MASPREDYSHSIVVVRSMNGAAGAVCARLRGEQVALPDEAVAFARAHRVHLLLAYGMAPAQRRAASLDAELRAAAVVEAWRSRQTQAVVAALSAAGVPSVLMKGAALAQTHYALPSLRPRGDLDLMIDPAAVDVAAAALTRAGWMPMVEPPATISSAQRHYAREEGGLREQLDLHWAVANARVFAPAVAFADLVERSVPVPDLGPNAR